MTAKISKMKFERLELSFFTSPRNSSTWTSTGSGALSARSTIALLRIERSHAARKMFSQTGSRNWNGRAAGTSRSRSAIER